MIKEQLTYEEKIQVFLQKSIKYEEAVICHFEERLQDISYKHDYSYLKYSIGQARSKIEYYNYLLGLLHKNNIEKSSKEIEEIENLVINFS